MEGAAILSFFVGLGLLLGPMTLPYDGGQDDDTTPYTNLPPAQHDLPPPTALLLEDGGNLNFNFSSSSFFLSLSFSDRRRLLRN